jgi:hypothetical protein
MTSKGNDTSAMAQTCQLTGFDNAAATTVMTPMQHEGKEVSTIRTTMLAQQGQQRLCNFDNGASTRRATMSLWQLQRCLCIDDGNSAIVTRARTPAWQQQQCHHNEGNNVITTMAKMPGLHQRWQHHCNKDNNASLIAVTMPDEADNVSLMTMLAWLRQRHHCIEGIKFHCNNSNDTCTSMATMSLQRGQQRHCNDGKDACASMMPTMPLQQGQQHQLEDGNNAIKTKATIPSWIKGNNAIVMRAKTPSWWRQGCLHINNSNNAIVMKVTIAIMTIAKMPAHWQQQRHCNEGNNASLTICNEGNNASSTTVETPGHWKWQQLHHDKSDNCHRNKGKDACTLTATTPAWQGVTRAMTLMMTTAPFQWGQQCQLEDGNNAITTRATTPLRIKCDNAIVTRVTMPSRQWQGCLRINNGNKTIITRATITITTMAKMPAHQWQQCHCNEGNYASLTMSNKGNNTSLTMVEMPAHQQWQWCHHDKSNNCYCNNGKDACALTATMPAWQCVMKAMTSKMIMMPLQQGQQHQLEDGNDAIAMRATTPPQIKGNDAIVTRATTPAQQWQGRLCINNGNNAIVMRATITITTMAKTPAHWRQQCHHNKGNNASLTTSNKGDDPSLTMVETLAHRQRQQRHCDKSTNCHCENGKDACARGCTHKKNS